MVSSAGIFFLLLVNALPSEFAFDRNTGNVANGALPSILLPILKHELTELRR